MGGWNFGLIGNTLGCAGGVCDVDCTENVCDFNVEFPSPQKADSYAIINEASEGDCDLSGISISDFWQDVHSKTDNDLLGVDSNTNTIPANANQLIIDSFSIPIANPENYNTIIYSVESGTLGVNVFFENSMDPLNTEDATKRLIAIISSRVIPMVLGEEYFHIRLVGTEQTECYDYDGTFGVTGEANKPRVRFNWNWYEITPDTCSSDNPNYIYCDATQFMTSLLHRLDKIKDLADEGLGVNIGEIQALRTFDAYIMQDSFTDDFRSDLKQFLLFGVFNQDPQQSLLADDNPWQEYLARPGEDSNLTFSQTDFTAGLYEVRISFNFDIGRGYGFSDFIFFGGSCDNGDCSSVDLLGKIILDFEKKAEPPVNSLLYRLPVNGSVGKTNSGSYDRQGYGIGFDNSANINPIIIVGDVDDPVVVADAESDVGTVEVVFVDDFYTINNANRGEIFSIGRNSDSGNPESIVFSPSIATPILLEIESENNKAEASYFLRTQNGNLLPIHDGPMNFWIGAGSTMGEQPDDCVGFNNLKLSYEQPDSMALDDSCAKEAQSGPIFQRAHGFNYTNAPNGEKMFFETVFFVPAPSIYPDGLILHDSCADLGDDAPKSKFYSPGESSGIPQVGLSDGTKYRTVSVQDVIDLIGQGYVCVSEKDSGKKLSFWWNSQKLLKALDPVKEKIFPGWDTDSESPKCNVSPFGLAPSAASN